MGSLSLFPRVSLSNCNASTQPWALIHLGKSDLRRGRHRARAANFAPFRCLIQPLPAPGHRALWTVALFIPASGPVLVLCWVSGDVGLIQVTICTNVQLRRSFPSLWVSFHIKSIFSPTFMSINRWISHVHSCHTQFGLCYAHWLFLNSRIKQRNPLSPLHAGWK